MHAKLISTRTITGSQQRFESDARTLDREERDGRAVGAVPYPWLLHGAELWLHAHGSKPG